MDKEKQEIEEQLKTDYRLGNFLKCSICGKEIIGKKYYFEGIVCEDCYTDIGDYYKKDVGLAEQVQIIDEDEYNRTRKFN